MVSKSGIKSAAPTSGADAGNSEKAVEILRTADELQSVREEWEDFLDNHAGDHDVRQNPFWIINKTEYPFEQSTPFVVILRDGGITCIAAFYIMPRKIKARFGPIEPPAPTLTVLRPFGDRIVHRKGSSPTENVRGLLNALEPFTDQFDAIWLPEINMPGDFWDTFEGGKVSRDGFVLTVLGPWTETVQMIDLAGNFDNYTSLWSGNTRRKRKGRLNKLAKTCGELTMSVVTEPEKMRQYLETADEIRNSSWKAKVFSTDRWKDENRIGFHEAVATRGWVLGFLLECKGRPIAYQLGYMYNGNYVAEEIAYVDEYRTLAPGAGLMLLLLEWFCEQYDACRILLQPTDSELKRSFGNATHEIGRAVVVPVTKRAPRLLFRSQRFVAYQHDRLSRLAKRIKTLRRKE